MNASKIREYVDCPTCGSRQSKDVRFHVINRERDYSNRDGVWTFGNGSRETFAVCANHENAALKGWDCSDTYAAELVGLGIVGKLITIKMRPSARSGRGCGGACINGKTSCDCPCEGRCHGAGTCYCVDD